MALNAALTESLICPQCGGALEGQENGVSCATCRLLYPFRDGILVMLVDEAETLEAEAGA